MFSSGGYIDDESQSAVIEIDRTGVTTGVSSVTFSTVAGGTATAGASCGAGADYPSTTVIVNFAAGVTSQTVSVPLCGDILVEGNETVNLALSNPSGAALGAQSTSVLTINDTGNQFRNPASIDMTLGGPASLYPSNITVAGATTNAFRIRVTLYDLSQTFPDNVKILLVGPNGAKYVLMADAGGPTPISAANAVTLTFADSAGVVLPDSLPLTTGKFLPTSWSTPIVNFPAPAPAGPYAEPGSTVARPAAATLYGNFAGSNANGLWSLYVRDDAGQPRPLVPLNATGSIAGGWGIEILAATAAGVEVSGRVTRPDGRGLAGARVVLTDAVGTSRTVTTSSFGYYSLANVEAGSTAVISVSSKHYRFTPRILNVADSLTDVDFAGIE